MTTSLSTEYKLIYWPLETWNENSLPEAASHEVSLFFKAHEESWIRSHKDLSLKALAILSGHEGHELKEKIKTALLMTPLDLSVCDNHTKEAEREWDKKHISLIPKKLSEKAIDAAKEGHFYLAYHFLTKERFNDLELTHPLLKTLYLAASYNLHEVIDVIYNMKGAISHEDFIKVSDLNDGFTPLHLACKAGSLEAFNKLVDKGFDPLEKGKCKISPLEMAINQPAILKAAVQKGVDPNTILLGEPLLAYTFNPSQKDLRKFLIEKGADIALLNQKIEKKIYMLPPRLQVDRERFSLPTDGKKEFLDPLMHTLMVDPVEVKGFIYDRQTIIKIIEKDKRCPFTRAAFEMKDVIPKTELKQQIVDYLQNL